MSLDDNITLVSVWIVRADAKPNCRGKRPSASGQSATSAGHASRSERSPEADIELSCVNVAQEHRRDVSKSTFPAME